MAPRHIFEAFVSDPWTNVRQEPQLGPKLTKSVAFYNRKALFGFFFTTEKT